MRFVLAAAILLSASAPTLAGSIVGLQEMALMQCAGFPVASMQMNGATMPFTCDPFQRWISTVHRAHGVR